MSVGGSMEVLLEIANIDLANRGIWKVFAEAYLLGRINLRKAAKSIIDSERVLLIVGFPIPPEGLGETDGPLGALCLALALESIGKHVEIIAERSVYDALKDVWGRVKRLKELNKIPNVDVLVSIETPGRALDNKYYSMRGIEISPEPLDELLLNSSGVKTISIGDGGNEAGMGSLRDIIVKHVPLGEKIASSVKADYVITGGTSNWASYALVGAISKYYSKNLLKMFEEKEYLNLMYKKGLIDGVLGMPNLSVDGIPLDILEKVYRLMESVVDKLIQD